MESQVSGGEISHSAWRYRGFEAAKLRVTAVKSFSAVDSNKMGYQVVHLGGNGCLMHDILRKRTKTSPSDKDRGLTSKRLKHTMLDQLI